MKLVQPKDINVLAESLSKIAHPRRNSLGCLGEDAMFTQRAMRYRRMLGDAEMLAAISVVDRLNPGNLILTLDEKSGDASLVISVALNDRETPIGSLHARLTFSRHGISSYFRVDADEDREMGQKIYEEVGSSDGIAHKIERKIRLYGSEMTKRALLIRNHLQQEGSPPICDRNFLSLFWTQLLWEYGDYYSHGELGYGNKKDPDRLAIESDTCQVSLLTPSAKNVMTFYADTGDQIIRL